MPIWLTLLLGIGGPLIGVGGIWFGVRLNARYALFKDAADVIGPTRVALRAMRPGQYAKFATTEGYDIPAEIELRKSEANEIRQRLAALAIRSPNAAWELNVVEEYMGLQPARLFRLIGLVTTRREYEQWIDLLAEYEEMQAGIEDALDRALEKLRP